MWNLLLDLLFPRRSLGGEEGAWITDEERSRIRLTPALLTKDELRRRGLKAIDAVIAAGSYDSSPLLRKAILTFKFRRVTTLSEDLGHWMADALHGLLLPPKFLQDTTPVLTAVPLHWSRRYERGFNQAELLGRVISKRTAWRMADLLRRIRPTGHQSRRQREERLTALEGAFRFSGTGKAPPYVILIDDLCTTGATLDECAKALKASGTEFVAAIVAALG